MADPKPQAAASRGILPRLLVLDDTFGRGSRGGPNADRENLCAHFLWQDGTGDAGAKASKQKVLEPTAEAVFCRAQTPACSTVGDMVANDLGSALEAVRKGWPEEIQDSGFRIQEFPHWSMVLLDLCFYTGKVTEESHRRTPGMPEGRPGDDDPRSYFGLTLLDAIHREFPELPIFILSSKPRDEVSLEFSRRGALGFIDRSALDGPELLEQALWQHGLLADPTGELVGHSLALLLALRAARRAAGHRKNVLIRGERGSGKELIARLVHRANSRFMIPESRSKGGEESEIQNPKSEIQIPFVVVNSATFTPELFASELFGIESKTATGVAGKAGLIESADGGELFLDEIADMPAQVQAGLLRVLQDRTVTRVGGKAPRQVDVRFLSASNADLEALIERGGFREDLVDRLREGGLIEMPPLRERAEDVPLLVERFVREAEAQRPGSQRRRVTPEAMEALMAHPWPGNIRELRSVVFDAVQSHPDVEHLVEGHLRIRRAEGGGLKPEGGGRQVEGGKRKAEFSEASTEEGGGRKAEGGKRKAEGGMSLGDLLEVLRAQRFEPDDIGDWAGRLEEVQTGCAWLLARQLEGCLEATKRRTPEQPEGVVQIHPAAKLATGNPNLTATKAADLFKRVLSPLEDELEGDLLEAYKTAVRLRPKGGRGFSP